MEELKKRCPFCKEKILEDAVKCRYCHEWLNGRRVQPPVAIPRRPRFSNAQSIERLIVLYILTCGFYGIYWYYRSWKHLRDYNNLDIKPFWRTVGLLIPIINIYLSYSLYSKIKEFGEDNECESKYSTEFLVFLFAIFDLYSWIIIYFVEDKISDPLYYFLISTSVVICDIISVYIIVSIQGTFNNIWEKLQTDLIIRKEFSDGEIVAIIAGFFIWILIIYIYASETLARIT